jgi:hypothetical protein
MVTEQMDDEENRDLRYRIRFVIHHPDIDPDRITKTLGLIPQHSAIAGSVRKTPKGTILPGLHRTSSWSHSFRVERHRHFFSEVVKMIDRLEPHKAFLNEIADNGGFISLIADLPGDVNIGSDFPWRDMARLSDLHIDLGVEVYPEYN